MPNSRPSASDRPAIDLLTGGPEYRAAVDARDAAALDAVIAAEALGAARSRVGLDPVGHSANRAHMGNRLCNTPIVVDIAEAKATLSDLVERANGGETIVLARGGKSRARIVPLAESAAHLRVPGKGKGRVWMAPDFDEPLPASVLAGFAGTDS